MHEDQLSSFPPDVIAAYIDAAVVIKDSKAALSGEWFSVASINIQTLSRIGKRAVLAEQFKKAGAAIIAL